MQNPLFYPNAGRDNNQLPLLPTYYTHFAEYDDQGISLIGERTIGFPGTTEPKPSFHAPP